MAGGKLGPWRGAGIRQTAQEFAGEGADEDLPDEIRFARGVGRLLMKRIRSEGDSMRRDAISVFLLHPEPATGVNPKREPMLGDGGVEVAGRIWFVAETAQSGRFLEPPSSEPGDVFDLLAERRLDRIPAVVFNPTVDPPTLRFYEQGVIDEHNPEVIEIGDQPVSVARIEGILDRLWETCFVTPDAQIHGGSAVWEKPSQRWAATNAEAIVQAHVKSALAIGLIDCIIRDEQPTASGRVDIEVERPSPDGTAWTRPVEIEIKVLRHAGATGRKTTPKYIQWWIRRGIRQAAAYRDDRGATHGMVCCFDMREVDHQHNFAEPANVNYAASNNVTVFRRYLYNDSESYRVARYGA